MLQQINKYSNYFLIGTLAILPIVIIFQIVLFVEEMFQSIFQYVYGYTANNVWMTLFTFIIAVALVIFIGYRAKNDKSHIINGFELIIDRIPFLNSVYRISKKILRQFSKEREKDSKEVVYIEYPKDNVWVPGYVTNRGGDMYVIYVPTSPNPTSGFTVIIHESKVVHSKMNIEEMTGFVVSVGVDYHKGGEMKLLNTEKKS